MEKKTSVSWCRLRDRTIAPWPELRKKVAYSEICMYDPTDTDLVEEVRQWLKQ